MGQAAERHIASVIVVNHAGHILLQLRDGGTPIDPHKWGLPGGHIEPGEEPVRAAERELEEETELCLARLELFWEGRLPGSAGAGAGRYWAFHGVSDVDDSDVACHEGAAMRFTPAEVISGLEFGRAIGTILRRYITSPQYRGIRDRLGL